MADRWPAPLPLEDKLAIAGFAGMLRTILPAEAMALAIIVPLCLLKGERNLLDPESHEMAFCYWLHFMVVCYLHEYSFGGLPGNKNLLGSVH